MFNGNEENPFASAPRVAIVDPCYEFEAAQFVDFASLEHFNVDKVDWWFEQEHRLHSPNAARALKLRTSIQRQADSSKKRFTPKRVFAAPVALSGATGHGGTRASPSPGRAARPGAIAKKLTFPSPAVSTRKRKQSGGVSIVVGSGAFGEARQKKLNMSSEEATSDVVEMARRASSVSAAEGSSAFAGTAKRLVFQLSPDGPAMVTSAPPSSPVVGSKRSSANVEEECELSPSLLVEKLKISSAKKPALEAAPSAPVQPQFAVKRLFAVTSGTPPARRLGGGAMRISASAQAAAAATATEEQMVQEEPPVLPTIALAKKIRPPVSTSSSSAASSLLSKMAPASSKGRSGSSTARLGGRGSNAVSKATRGVATAPAAPARGRVQGARSPPPFKLTVNEILRWEKENGKTWHHLSKLEKEREVLSMKENAQRVNQ